MKTFVLDVRDRGAAMKSFVRVRKTVRPEKGARGFVERGSVARAVSRRIDPLGRRRSGTINDARDFTAEFV